MIELKCTKCGAEGLEKKDFPPDKRRPGGIGSDCKECRRAAAKEYRRKYYETNREEVLAKAKQRYKEKDCDMK